MTGCPHAPGMTDGAARDYPGLLDVPIPLALLLGGYLLLTLVQFTNAEPPGSRTYCSQLQMPPALQGQA
jgi:hypothetical protein